jgi:hypothetical protein
MTEYYNKKYNVYLRQGEYYNNLYITKIERQERNNYKTIYVTYICFCGNENTTKAWAIAKKRTQSCGCLQIKKIKTHGKSYEWWYRTFRNIVTRCYNPNNSHYHCYGGRGIKVCKEWNYLEIGNEKAIENFEKWINENNFQPGLTIERIDVNKDYCPENCTFIPIAEQSDNKTSTRKYTLNGETKSVRDWIDSGASKVSYSALLQRLNRGWDINEALNTPPLKSNGKIKNEYLGS